MGELNNGNFLNLTATLIIEMVIVAFILIIDFLIYNAEANTRPVMKAENKDNIVGFIQPNIIINDWADRTWYNLASENSLNIFFRSRPYLIISNKPKKKTPIGIRKEISAILSALIIFNKLFSAKKRMIPKKRQNISKTRKQSLKTFSATVSSFGKTIAISYLRLATTPNNVIIEIKSWYLPKSEAEKIVVIIGSVIATVIPEKIVLVDSFSTLDMNSFWNMYL